jgi:hypothetical protein
LPGTAAIDGSPYDPSVPGDCSGVEARGEERARKIGTLYSGDADAAEEFQTLPGNFGR